MTIVYRAEGDPENSIYNCNQYEIPELANTGFVLIKSPKEIEVYKSHDSEPMKYNQSHAKAKVYKACDEDRRSKFEKYVLPLISCVVKSAVSGVVSGALDGALKGAGEAATYVIGSTGRVLYEAE